MRRVCIISDDFYYLVGIEESTTESVDTIFFTNTVACMEELSEREYLFFLISISSLEVTRHLVNKMAEKNLKMTLIYDVSTDLLYSHARCLSKRESLEGFNRYLIDRKVGRKKEENKITHRQKLIIKRLVTGCPLELIAREEHRSLKTISGIKKVIMSKIGIKDMNDLSLIIMDMIICSAKSET